MDPLPSLQSLCVAGGEQFVAAAGSRWIQRVHDVDCDEVLGRFSTCVLRVECVGLPHSKPRQKTIFRAMSESVPELSDDQPEIQSGDHGGQTPSQDANPDCIDKFSHDGGVAREMNQRHDGKAKLHAQDHLAQQ